MARQRRSFPIKISTDYAKRDVAEAVLIDLVHKHPRGPNVHSQSTTTGVGVLTLHLTMLTVRSVVTSRSISTAW